MKSMIAGVLMAVILYAQDPDTLWTRVYGGAGDDLGSSVAICPDSGYIICGSTSSFGAGGWDVYLIRTDNKGDTIWTRTYGGSDNDYGRDAGLTHDGGFIIAGYTRSYGSGGHDLYLIRVDSLGDTLWTRTFGGTNVDEAYSVLETPDFGYVMCGTTYSFGAGIGDVYLVKTDSLGDSLWAYTYGGDDNDLGADLTLLPDSGLMVCATTYSYGAGGGDAYLIRTDAKGDTIWTRTHGGDSDEWAYDIMAAADSGFVVSGTSYFSLLGDEMFVFKVDAGGNNQWNFFNGSLGDDYAYAAAEIPGRGYVIVGNFSYELFVIRTDRLGNNQRQWIFGGAGTDCAMDAAVHEDGSYAVVANTTSFGQGMTDIWLIKMAADTLVIKESPGPPISVPAAEAYPNPFRDHIHLSPGHGALSREPGASFQDFQTEDIVLKIYDISGRMVKNLLLPVSGSRLNSIVWNGKDQAGRPAPAGVYFLENASGQTKRMEKIVRLE